MTGATMKRISKCIFMLSLAAQVAFTAAPAAATSAVLTGVVIASGVPVANVEVTAAGNNGSQKTRTDANGRFAFPNLSAGSYLVTATGDGGKVATTIDLAAAGADITLTLAAANLGIVTTTAPPP